MALPRSEARQQALLAALSRLRSLRVADYALEPAAVHVTVGPEAEALLPLYEGLVQAR